MELFETIAKRHSYRGPFQDKAVPREDLQKIVQAGLAAPSGCNAQTTRFVIVDDAQLVERIKALPGGNDSMSNARAYIACIVDQTAPSVYEGLSFQVEDCAAAVANMLLAVTALGYATVWVDGWLRRENRAGTIGEWLGVPKDKVIRIILPLGVPAEDRSQPEKLPFERRAWYNRYEV